jgi:hypothetical protein
MRHTSVIAVGLTLIGLAGCQSSNDAAAEAEWTTLFDGTNLDSFNTIGDANWMLADGAVEANMGTGMLVTKDSYGDFELTAEFWVDEPANSGVFIRCEDPNQVGADNSYEVNIFDTRPDPTYRTGGIVNVAAPAAQINAGGQWNTYVITAEGPHLTVTLNGTQTVDAQSDLHASGPIALQYGSGIVKFRSVKIRAL